ncbi:MAG TPA: inositol monophosphatase [Stellaceae bacterium]|jgi:fructose-1,6-bisphosphatase/inositol monophosphatase family enzyme|nr:inositol monophosphatase [Stellaceae bacterium]
MLDPEKIAALIRETAQAEILPRFRMLGESDIREKKPGDFVTAADLAAERRMTEWLTEAAPGSLVLGEEAAAEDPGRLALLASEARVWIIDPVDGTANFARGEPGFAVILAEVQKGEVCAGWIYDPLSDVMVTAEAGGGAWSAGRRLTVARDVAPAELVGGAYGRTKAGVPAAKALEASGRIGRIRNRGCGGLEYLDLALGRAHFSLHSRSLPWDHAAGMLITAEAGGVGAFLDGSRYDARIIDRPVLAAASAEAWQIVQEVVSALA